MTESSGIGTLNEGPLHAALKELVAEPGDEFEVPLAGFVIDVVRSRGTARELLIEIQTGSLGALGPKLDHLLGEHRIHLVHPIAVRTTLERPDGSRRRSPKRGDLWALFDQLVSVPTLLDHPNLTLEIVLAEVTARQSEPGRRRRGGRRVEERRLDRVVERRRFDSPDDVAALLPVGLPPELTTADLAAAAGVGRDRAQKAAFCLRATGHLVEIGRDRRGVHYRRST